MSTILKALRRLEEEKRAGGERPLREEVASPGPPARPSPSRLPWLLGLAGLLCVGIAVALGGVRWLGEGEGSGPDADVAARQAAEAPVTRAAAPARPAPAAPARRTPAPPQPAAEETPEEAFASDVEVVPRPRVEPRRPIELTRPADPLPEADASAQRAASPPPVERPATTSPPPVERPATTSPPPVERLATTSPPAPVARTRPAPAPEPEPEVVARAPEPDPEPVVKSSPTPPPAPETQAKAPPPPPEPAPSLPTTAKAEPLPGSPEISVQRTLWHPSASRRSAFVVLGGEPAQRVEEGDVVGRYVVQEIQPSRVVFLHDGKPLERKVGGP